jgi:hypothetical protein
MTDTVGYYNLNAARYAADTPEVDLSALRQRFPAPVPVALWTLPEVDLLVMHATGLDAT